MNEQDTRKLDAIVDSFYNGQKKQMVQQIKAYGQKAFLQDFFVYAQEIESSNPERLYARVVYNFATLND